MSYTDQLEAILSDAKELAARNYKLTSKPLGITGEMGEYLAAKHLGLQLADARTAGYDAKDPSRNNRLVQIKSRRVPNRNKLGGQKMGSIKCDSEWDTVMLVIMANDFDLESIHEAERSVIENLLCKTESKARKRGALAISEFLKHATQRWPLCDSLQAIESHKIGPSEMLESVIPYLQSHPEIFETRGKAAFHSIPRLGESVLCWRATRFSCYQADIDKLTSPKDWLIQYIKPKDRTYGYDEGYFILSKNQLERIRASRPDDFHTSWTEWMTPYFYPIRRDA